MENKLQVNNKTRLVAIQGFYGWINYNPLLIYWHHDYFKTLGLSISFIEYLSLNNLFQPPIDEDEIEGTNEKDVIRYLTWNFIPSYSDIAAIEAILTDMDHNFNQHQKECLAVGYHGSTFIEAGFDRSVYCKWLDDPSVGSIHDKFMTVFRHYLNDQRVRAIETHGWALQGVGSEGIDPAFAYTIGLTTKLGYEIIAVNGPCNTLGSILNWTCQALIDGKIELGKCFTIDSFYVGVGENKENTRAILIDCPMESSTAAQVLGRVNGIAVTQIKQLLLGDKNNCLPMEDNYDQAYVYQLKG